MHALDGLRKTVMRSGIVMPSGDDMRSCANGEVCIFGFTLIELLAAIAIVSVLAAIAAPSFVDYLRRGRIIEAVSRLSDYHVRMEQYFLDNRRYDDGSG